MRRILVVGSVKDAATLSQAINFFGYEEIEVAPVKEFHTGPRAFEDRKREGVLLVAVTEGGGVAERILWAGYDPSMLEMGEALERFFLAHQKTRAAVVPNVPDPIPGQTGDFTGQVDIEDEASAIAPRAIGSAFVPSDSIGRSVERGMRG